MSIFSPDWVTREKLEVARRQACRILRNADDAEDCVSEAALRLCRAMSGKKVETNLDGYFARTVAATCVDFIRRDSRRPGLTGVGGDVAAGCGATTDGGMSLVLEAMEAERKLDVLSPGQRALILRYARGEGSESIGDSIGKSDNEVRSLIYRWRRLMAQAGDA